MEPIQPSPATPFRAWALPSIYGLYLGWILFMDLFIPLALAAGAIGGLISGDIALACAMLGAAAFWIWISRSDFKLPFRTTFDGHVLTTYSLAGKKSMDLNAIVRVDTIGYIHGRYGTSNHLPRLTSTSGERIYVGFSSLSHEKRQALIQYLTPFVEHDGVEISYSVKEFRHNWRMVPSPPPQPPPLPSTS